ncbi:Zn(II)2Cys6 transcription factor domain-containing protein [Aspergillus tanneri]|uniref:Zn(2)-C6 fungal-type domain-containing protein n=1 Tax=Aspergillus tanneri TaxID=1220188 RepID=A0A5M9MG45_9EURO|nr:uncharacterized protein ATNIH1004_010876 [Aspergillus tanneri]KAA8641937.1 hypothetical protein ATNIH1004_010876 [Aspergillus tanneri]
MVHFDSRGLLPEESGEKETVVGSDRTARQTRSCKVCRARKVRCDRIKPCHACCAHGYPSKCVYEPTSDEDPRPISQAEEIDYLRTEIRELTVRLNNREHRNRTQRRFVELKKLFESIRSAPLDVVDRIVSDIRTSKGEVIAVSGSSWEGVDVHDRALAPRSSCENYVDELVQDNGCAYVCSDQFDFNRSPSVSSDESSSGSSILCLTSTRPMLDIFIERFVDAFSPEVDVKSGQAGALRRAAEIRMFSPILTDAFETVSVAFFGRSIQDKGLEASGLCTYPRVLRSLQEALQDPERSKAESTLVTVILLMAFESVERTTQGSLSAHIQGALRLIEHRGAENHIYGVEHLLFAELRPYWVGAAIVNRTPSFLAQDEWKTIPWSANTTKKDILHHLLDLAVDIPAVLSQHDSLQSALESKILMSAHETAVKQTTLWNCIADLTHRFLQWKEAWVDNYEDGPQREVDAEPSDQFPIFRCRDLQTGATIIPPRFVYPNLRLAQTMCLYYSSRLVLSSIDTRPDHVSPAEQYELGCGICRSLEWYILTAPGNMINRLAFPVRVAWEVFPDGGPERTFIYEVLKLVEKRHALGLWGSAMPEFSPRASSPPKTG